MPGTCLIGVDMLFQNQFKQSELNENPTSALSRKGGLGKSLPSAQRDQKSRNCLVF